MTVPLLIVGLGATLATPAAEPPARFVLVVANNEHIDAGGPDLRYADDDGAAYYALFSAYARHVELLAVLDDDTQRRYPDLGAVARPPTRAALTEQLAALYAAIESATAAGETTELTFIYVGHGNLDDEGHGTLTLADGELTRADLFAEIVGRSPADTTHLIIDACEAYSLVAGRGEGEAEERRRDLRAFLAGHDLEDYPSVGVLVATSAERETHEWSAWRAGIFSHQIRSALAGAADVNHDGRIEYSEVAAFVGAANSGLEPLGKTIETFAWPPPRDRRAPVLDLRDGRETRYVVVGDGLSGRLFVEDERGVRWADFHKSAGEPLVLALPTRTRLFLRGDERETEIPPGTDVLRLAGPLAGERAIASRGAVDRAFQTGLFSIPFGDVFYRGFLSGHPQLLAVMTPPEPFVIGRGPGGDDASAEPPAWEVGAGYQIGSSALRSDRVEHGAHVRAGLRVLPWLMVGLGLEAAYTDLSGTRSTGSTRFGALGAAVLTVQPWSWLDLRARLELGYGLVQVAGPTDAVDPTVGLGRVGAGIGFNVWGPIWLDLEGAATASVLSFDGSEELRGSGQGLVGLRFGGR